ncbi:Ctr copper transporter [Massariosphaeria phaeospora]|uniref:Copper transport protein n=1 Tax=Massariosphaeria phaeospora TaxID=100035 RepID=A0A7C8M3Y9_9PLEO|nr:Ctr copper transporter [Massariosphaeria phaeospora]
MTFFTSTTTPLFTMTWTPTSTGQYAGTCIFLIVFAAIFRALLAIRFNIDELMASIKRGRGDDQMPLYTGEAKRARRPWRANEAAMLGAMDVLVGAVSYLLMIAVMTMNVGYFLSVLAGIFVGSMAFGRFMTRSVAH